MSERQSIKIKEILDSANTGLDAIKRAPIVDYDSGIKCLRIQDVSQRKDFVNWGFCEVEQRNFDKFRLRKGDIIIARTGATVGVNKFISHDVDSVFNNGLIRLRVKTNKCLPEYLYYNFRTSYYNSFIESISGGTSTQPNMQINALLSFEISLPLIPEQKFISETLSSLDDKINLLHRQNKTLEALAETLFRQWFVEEAEEESVKLGDVVKTSSGGTPSRAVDEYYLNGTIKWVKSKELHGGFIFETEEMITDEAVKKSSAKLFPANTILIAMYGATVGEYAMLAEPATCNQAICGLMPNENYPYTFLFILTKYNKENLIGLAGGSAQQNISQELIKELQIPKSISRIKEYHDQVEPMFQKIKSNAKQIKTLTQLRDTILPKLMSGEARVSEL